MGARCDYQRILKDFVVLVLERGVMALCAPRTADYTGVAAPLLHMRAHEAWSDTSSAAGAGAELGA